MFRSMTGFGRSEVVYDWGTVVVEVSSVNHRYSEISVRLPKELARLEPQIISIVKANSSRGKITVRLDVRWSAQYSVPTINKNVLEGYIRDLEEISETFSLGCDIRLEHLLTLPGVLEPPLQNKETIFEDVAKALTGQVESALVNWNEMREVEGSHLLGDVLKYVQELEKRLVNIARTWDFVKEKALADFRERIETILAQQGVEADESRIIQEIVILSDKWDISEELDRLDSHMKKLRELLYEKAFVSGKKIDFLLQEINREINTIGSKASDSDIRWEIVEAKASIESMREQIQNVE
ncbi:YicC/YloC family endoribonuclease [Thermovirga lienii]|uniref:YicC/YloC family endoribonuclease n=1 Tax=Thermovirga lienii TaxID=336261 RepID=UPI000317467C|nr:YicC family protein [Thermovirga lienii]